MADEFTDLPAFVAVVELGSFAEAARKLGQSRSAIGKAIARLEQRLGTRLFHRTSRSQSLTDDGRVFHERCQRALEELRTGIAILEAGREIARGRLRVSMPVLFGRRCVAPALSRLTTLHPGLELELNFSDRPIDLIEDGYDLAVRNGAIGDGLGLMTRRIAHERTSVFAAPAYLARHGEPRTVAELAQHRAVTYSRGGHVQHWLFPQPGNVPRAETPSSSMRFDDLDAIAEAACSGFGLAWLPCWWVNDRVRAGQLRPVLTDIPALITDVHVIWPETPHLAVRVRVAIDTLVSALPTASDT